MNKKVRGNKHFWFGDKHRVHFQIMQDRNSCEWVIESNDQFLDKIKIPADKKTREQITMESKNKGSKDCVSGRKRRNKRISAMPIMTKRNPNKET